MNDALFYNNASSAIVCPLFPDFASGYNMILHRYIKTSLIDVTVLATLYFSSSIHACASSQDQSLFIRRY